MLLEHIELNTAAEPDASVIWLHGLGADGNDFAAIVPELKLPPQLRIRFIFPHAPFRAITLNNGYVMRGWYDIASLQFGSQEDDIGIMESADQINDFINNEIRRGIAPDRIILAGFSQGGAIALYTGLHQPENLGGIMALSTYMPLVGKTQAGLGANRELPIFMGHGLEDDVVSYQYGVQTRIWLQQQGYQPQWHDYPMAHSVCMEEIAHIRQWLLARLQHPA
ncbi:MAG: carboxylesterase [Gammaproteobacteria bacterium]|jgi:phospholipase/carboxylesterase|nr:carboxylesterase [Gammaproteobacteria bacterium]